MPATPDRRPEGVSATPVQAEGDRTRVDDRPDSEDGKHEADDQGLAELRNRLRMAQEETARLQSSNQRREDERTRLLRELKQAEETNHLLREKANKPSHETTTATGRNLANDGGPVAPSTVGGYLNPTNGGSGGGGGPGQNPVAASTSTPLPIADEGHESSSSANRAFKMLGNVLEKLVNNDTDIKQRAKFCGATIDARHAGNVVKVAIFLHNITVFANTPYEAFGLALFKSQMSVRFDKTLEKDDTNWESWFSLVRERLSSLNGQYMFALSTAVGEPSQREFSGTTTEKIKESFSVLRDYVKDLFLAYKWLVEMVNPGMDVKVGTGPLVHAACLRDSLPQYIKSYVIDKLQGDAPTVNTVCKYVEHYANMLEQQGIDAPQYGNVFAAVGSTTPSGGNYPRPGADPRRCYNCGQLGHIASICPTKPPRPSQKFHQSPNRNREREYRDDRAQRDRARDNRGGHRDDRFNRGNDNRFNRYRDNRDDRRDNRDRHRDDRRYDSDRKSNRDGDRSRQNDIDAAVKRALQAQNQFQPQPQAFVPATQSTQFVPLPPSAPPSQAQLLQAGQPHQPGHQPGAPMQPNSSSSHLNRRN